MTTDQARAQGVHELKCWKQFYAEVEAGRKTFEIRWNDRDYCVGDVLLLKEWDHLADGYTGRELRRTVTYITDWEQKRGFVVMGLKDDTAIRAARGEAVKAFAASLIGDKGPHQTLHINAQFLRQYSEQAALDAGKEQ